MSVKRAEEFIIDFKKLRLALYYHTPVDFVEGKILTDFGYGKWIESLAPYFKEITLICHSTTSQNELMYQIKAKNVSYLDLGPVPSLKARILNQRKYASLVSQHASQWDIVGFRVPNPLSIYLYPSIKDKIVFFLLVGNMLNALKTAPLDKWKKLILTAYWRFYQWRLSRQANESITFANGPYLRIEYPRIRDIRILHTSTISADEIQSRRDCCQSATINLLNIGYIRSEKSLDTAIKAVKMLIDRGLNCKLQIIGPKEGDEYLRLYEMTEKLGLNGAVNFIGYLPHGPELFSILDEADILVIPSKWDWQPRTTFEGMARGLPVIASRGVKSFPMLYKDKEEMYFVDPERPEQIAEAVLEISQNERMRKQLIASSLRIASEKTLEKSAELLLAGLKDYMIKRSFKKE